MLGIERYNHDSNDDGDPPAAYTTEAEIAIADHLRHRLEERYLAPAVPILPPRERWNESH